MQFWPLQTVVVSSNHQGPENIWRKYKCSKLHRYKGIGWYVDSDIRVVIYIKFGKQIASFIVKESRGLTTYSLIFRGANIFGEINMHTTFKTCCALQSVPAAHRHGPELQHHQFCRVWLNTSKNSGDLYFPEWISSSINPGELFPNWKPYTHVGCCNLTVKCNVFIIQGDQSSLILISSHLMNLNLNNNSSSLRLLKESVVFFTRELIPWPSKIFSIADLWVLMVPLCEPGQGFFLLEIRLLVTVSGNLDCDRI